MFVVLLVRLVIMAYLLYPVHRNLFAFYLESSMFTILLVCYFCDDQFLNYIGFGFLLVASLFSGLNQIRRALEEEKTILDYADYLE